MWHSVRVMVSTSRLLALLSGLLLTAPPVAAAELETLGRDLPLALRDGRMARVTVVRLPFAPDRTEPEGGVAAAFEGLVRAVPAPCLLSLQLVGLAAPAREGEAGTLGLHRLARERAERLARRLAAVGVPEARIAAVWDWQLRARRAAVLAWLFALDPEDCTEEAPAVATVAEEDVGGTASAADGAAGTAVADAAGGERGPVRAPAAAEGAGGAVRAAAPARGATGDAVAEKPGEAPGATVGDAATPRPVPPRPGGGAVTVAAEAGTGTAPVAATTEGASAAGSATEVLRRREASGPAGAGEVQGATAGGGMARPRAGAVASAGEGPPVRDAGTEGVAVADGAEAAPGGTTGTVAVAELRLTFAVNSSFLGRENVRRLEAFVRGLGEGRWIFELSVPVGPAEGVRARSRAQAEAYERWMAERRARRIVRQLERLLGERLVDVRVVWRENDPSRTVVLRGRPVAAPAGAAAVRPPPARAE